MRLFLLFLCYLLIVTACQTYSEQDKTTFDKTIQDYIKKNKLSLKRTSSGLYQKTMIDGEGELIRYTDSVKVTYVGKLLNGKIVDKQTNPRIFAIKDLIAGWKEALISNRNKSKIMMIIPPQLGYGDRKLDDIPVNSILYFEMTVLDVK